jgi:leucyl aminopeptidase
MNTRVDARTQVEVSRGSIESFEADAIVVNLFRGVKAPGGATGAVDQALGGQISDVIAGGGFRGKLGETVVLYSRGEVAAPRVIVVGLGPADEFGLEEVRRASAAATKAARGAGARHVATIVHGAGIGGLDVVEASQAVVEGALLSTYSFRRYKTDGNEDGDAGSKRSVRKVSVVERSDDSLAAVARGAETGEATAAGVMLTRDLGNEPANTATPTFLAAQASEIAERYGMRLEVWDRERIIEEGMGAFASVAAGAVEPPRFIVLEHAPDGLEEARPYVLVGKGITFDTGGISLKQSLHMGDMKFDMCGAAAVLGAMESVGRLGLQQRVFGLVAATENMPDGSATRPGDIVRAMNGTTIEVLNTDAEGRLVLADALSYAQRLEPAAVVDLATLTGAIVVALGRKAAGLFSNDDALARQLEGAGRAAGEKLWRMPLWDDYADMIKSDTADIKNTSDTRPAAAGSVFAAKFLERFVDYPWAHLDIAGVAWKASGVPYVSKGATGFGVRLLLQWLREQERGGSQGG